MPKDSVETAAATQQETAFLAALETRPIPVDRLVGDVRALPRRRLPRLVRPLSADCPFRRRSLGEWRWRCYAASGSKISDSPSPRIINDSFRTSTRLGLGAPKSQQD